MSRKTKTNFPGAFRVVLNTPWGIEYKGPYQTKAAAKGQLTSETEGWYSDRGITGHIEVATGWEKVEDK